MIESLLERINRGFWQQIIGFFILWFAIYSVGWTIVEPLELAIISNHTLWPFVFIGPTFLLTFIVFFSFFFRMKLEKFGFEAGDTDLQENNLPEGFPKIAIQNDGFHGRILSISSNESQDSMNWSVKASANKAKFLTLIYKPLPDLTFYARVSVLSKNKKSTTLKWLRFEPQRSLPQSTADDEEMGVPVTATDDNGLLRVNIDLSKTIINAFGSHGWRFVKILSIRAKGSGKIKSIILK